MDPVTPLRRSGRVRYPTPKAIGSSPSSSPGSAAHHSRSVTSRPRVFYAPGHQSDSDSTLRNTNSSKSSGSSTEDTVGDAADPVGFVSFFPPKIYEAYERLAPLLRHSNAELMRRDIACLNAYVNELSAFLLRVTRAGFSHQWAEFNNFVELCNRITALVDAKKGTASPKKQKKREETGPMGIGKGVEFAVGPTWVAAKAEYWQETWDDTADPEYLQRLYRNAAAPNNFSWDDVGAGGSEVRPAETDALDYSLSYPTAKSLDYCTIPDTY